MERIGFVGIGTMGKPMARNLLKAGYPLTVHNRSRAAEEELTAEGARSARSPVAVATQSDIVVTMLPDSPDVAAVVAGKEGILQAARTGLLIIDTSTISPVVSRQLAKQAEVLGVDMLDAPVSGGEIGAVEGTLSIMVGGKEEAFDRALEVFQAMGKNIVRIGDAGAGQVAKAANQIIVALTIQAVAEALVLATKAGVDPAKVRQALLGGFASSRVLDVHGQRMLDHNFKPGFRTSLHLKDLGIALATAKEYAVPLTLTAQVQQMMNALIASDKGNLDHSSLVTLIEQFSNTVVRPC